MRRGSCFLFLLGKGGDMETSCLPCKNKAKFSLALYSGWIVLFFFIIFFFCIYYFTNSPLNSNSTSSITNMATITQQALTYPQTIIPFTCNNMTNLTCSSSKIPIPPHTLPPSSSCPDYFRWIHEDLGPWALTGITQEAVMRARDRATFRLIILNGRVYFEKLKYIYQTRDVFTVWGILQLIRRYPGRVPDLDIMFNCEDPPMIKKADYIAVGSPIPPPLFRYCKDGTTLDIVFPDWSFWGWAEINIKSWERALKEIKEGNERTKWVDREPYAFWKGNPTVAGTRVDLLRCNVSKDHEWNARVYVNDWFKEIRTNFKESNLEDQCTHRYKIYIEGGAWSVSEKFILACDSPTLFVNTRFDDFLSRALIPGTHYWPIRDNDKCRSIKFAVDWGNSHQKEAQEIGKRASKFMQEEMSMDNIYDYMLHLLIEYSKLLKYKPVVPEGAVEYCSESMACPSKGRHKTNMMDSLVNTTHYKGPCSLPPPYDPGELQQYKRMIASSRKQIEDLEEEAWKKH
ncbi:Protein xylosyltransferase protein [Dioscorea alata]|uniref:Protein xylosyltransferase protein n=1 Tax=Dioscorea alata TaxID=55571 RepID=A0ACB7V7E7_DIOAL|nr:Protein xylosyltransferase protein [Dioscorea alata]